MINVTWELADFLRDLIETLGVIYLKVDESKDFPNNEFSWTVIFTVPSCSEERRNDIINGLRRMKILGGHLEGNFQYSLRTLNYEYTTSTLSGELSIFQKMIRE